MNHCYDSLLLKVLRIQFHKFIDVKYSDCIIENLEINSIAKEFDLIECPLIPLSIAVPTT